MTSGYVAAAIVAVVIDGAFVPSVPTAALVRGRVVAGASLVARFTDRANVNADGAIVVLRDGRTCSAAPTQDDPWRRVALAPLVRCLGGVVAWDPRARTLSIAFPRTDRLRSPEPFDPRAPQVAPTMIFTPEPSPPSPRAIDTGAPRPRRTAIPVVPSWPVATTRPRR